MPSKSIQHSVLYVSKVYRMMKGNYPPMPCFATLHLHDENVINSSCDCENHCKFPPGDSSNILVHEKYSIQYSYSAPSHNRQFITH